MKKVLHEFYIRFTELRKSGKKEKCKCKMKIKLYAKVYINRWTWTRFNDLLYQSFRFQKMIYQSFRFQL